MENKEKKINKKKVIFITEISILAVLVVLFLVSLILELAAPTIGYSVWVKENIWDIENTVASLKTHLPTFITSIIWIIIIFAICKLLRIVLKKNMVKSNRAKTVITLVDGFVKYGCAVALIVLILKALGVDTTAIFASVGILTLVIGLGAQPLISDIIAGMFIIFENEYNVGEIITVDGFRGTVIEIGIRSTKLLDMAGNIKIINNSKVSNIVNMSRELSLAIVDCEFPYDVPIELMEKLMMDNLEEMKKKIPAIMDGPFYKGVAYYGESNVAIRLIAKCNEEDRYQVQRDIMREYRQIITAHNIDISYPQVVLNQAKPTEYTVSAKDKKKVEAFYEEQKEASKDLDGTNNQ